MSYGDNLLYPFEFTIHPAQTVRTLCVESIQDYVEYNLRNLPKVLSPARLSVSVHQGQQKQVTAFASQEQVTAFA